MSKKETIYCRSNTEQNLMQAFAAECQASVRYSYYSSVAKKCGYEQLAAIYLMAAENEREHAKLWFKELCLLGNVTENLQDTVLAEHEEWTKMYPEYAEEAEEEGFGVLADLFKAVGDIEKQHECIFSKYLADIECESVFRKPDETIWRCRNCGYTVVSHTAPEECPVCKHPEAYFEDRDMNIYGCDKSWYVEAI